MTATRDFDEPQFPDTEGLEVEALFTTTGDGTDECTMAPRDAPVDVLTTMWITAEEGSYVDPAEVR